MVDAGVAAGHTPGNVLEVVAVVAADADARKVDVVRTLTGHPTAVPVAVDDHDVVGDRIGACGRPMQALVLKSVVVVVVVAHTCSMMGAAVATVVAGVAMDQTVVVVVQSAGLLVHDDVGRRGCTSGS